MYIIELEPYLNKLLSDVPLTVDILLYKHLGKTSNIQWINWAVEMLNVGYDSDNIAILAGEDIHCNPFEFAALTDKIFDEWKLNKVTLEQIVNLYTVFHVQQAIQFPHTVQASLDNFEKLYIDTEQPIFYNFYILSNAVYELKEMGEQYYWNDPCLTKENIEEYVVDYFKKWIKEPTFEFPLYPVDNLQVINKKKNFLTKLFHFFKK